MARNAYNPCFPGIGLCSTRCGEIIHHPEMDVNSGRMDTGVPGVSAVGQTWIQDERSSGFGRKDVGKGHECYPNGENKMAPLARIRDNAAAICAGATSFRPQSRTSAGRLALRAWAIAGAGAVGAEYFFRETPAAGVHGGPDGGGAREVGGRGRCGEDTVRHGVTATERTEGAAARIRERRRQR